LTFHYLVSGLVSGFGWWVLSWFLIVFVPTIKYVVLGLVSDTGWREIAPVYPKVTRMFYGENQLLFNLVLPERGIRRLPSWSRCLCCSACIITAMPVRHLTAAPSQMPRVHQRMGCRRGQPWRAPTSLSSDSPSLSSELFARCYPSTRNGRGRLRASRHHLGPPSSSGSAIFSFKSSLHRPRIMAHITVVFHETT